MDIDWITVSAQIVNFLILVWLLKHFLYRPVMNAMQQREQRISDRLDEAQQREQQAEEKVQRYEDKTGELEQRHDEILADTKRDAEQEKKQMLKDARAEVDEQSRNWQRQVDREKEEFLEQTRQRMAAAFTELARRALRDLANAELEQQIVQQFLERLQSLDKKTRRSMTTEAGTVRVTSSFELESAVRGRLTRAIHEHLGGDIEVEYRRSDDVLCGIEMSAGGQQLEWNLARYIDELAARIEENLSPAAGEKEE